MDNPDNLGIYDVNTIIKFDPDIEEFLDSNVGKAYERTDSNSRFVSSQDVTFGEDFE